ncbi:unnamed protein product [Mytilus coruscus]|uniref:Uncharacterized protein n=1 Tax=Mytilus coruscus TaxID=42192 RepID=A0A6J8DZM5_MYTCO|nr:unnamed protein product [Mytilus coruscus]
MEFDIGVDFIGTSVDVRHDDIATRFRDDILHPDHGIRSLNSYVIDYHFLQQALKSMDSEHDKNIVKSILTKFLTRDQIYSLGIKPDRVIKQSQRLGTIFEEISNATVAAEDMLALILKSKIGKAVENVKCVNEQIGNEHNMNTLHEIRRLDLLAKKEILEENIVANKNLLDKADKISKQKFQQCVKRLAQQLIKENRVKLRNQENGCFVQKKPPRTEDDKNLLTHHQRAHVKLNRHVMFGKYSMMKLDSMEISFDDKAYIRPGTDDDQFFWNGPYSKQYCDASKPRKLEVPGHGYFSKMFDFISTHIEIGEFLTPFEVEGTKRQIDDYQPRANLKRLFSYGNISSQNKIAGSEFSVKFIVPEEKVNNFIRHLETMKLGREKRMLTAQQKRQSEAEKTYEEINWDEMFENNLIEKQTVATLNNKKNITS